MIKKYLLLIFLLYFSISLVKAQCTVNVTNLQHINCPNGGAVGGANIFQASYASYSWQNITNGQLYNGGGGNGGTVRTDLDAGLYVILASNPYFSACPSMIYSDTFEILEAEPVFQFNPTQACPSSCNVLVNASMQVAISGVNYTYQFDSNPIVNLPNTLSGQCGGMHTYEIFADNISCGVENIGISQFAQMNLATSVVNTCVQQGAATVSITGTGASGLSNYCLSKPQFASYTTIDYVMMAGDNSTIISNNTAGTCDMYTDYTVPPLSQSVDVTPGGSYNLTLNLGSCAVLNLTAIAKVYIDWNIDGDFFDVNELVGQVPLSASPSTHTIPITIPIGAVPGKSRMRIVAQSVVQQSNNSAESCDYNVAYYGSTEDYTIQVSGAVAYPVSYSWNTNPIQTTQTATGLSQGTYTCTVTDFNGCSASTTAVVGPSNISVSATFDQTICNGYAPSSLNASSGGISGTYSWVNASNPSAILGTGSNFSPPPLTATTTYTVTFTETVTGCTATDDVVITVVPLTTPTFNQIAPICAGGSFTLPTTSTNGISGSWSPAPNFNATTTYTFSPTGSSTCVNNTTMTVVVNPIPTVTLTANPNPACIGNNILLTANSALAGLYRFQYNSGGGWINFNNPGWSSLSTQTFSNIQNNTDFRVKVREANGCTASPWSNITVPVNTIVTPPISHN